MKRFDFLRSAIFILLSAAVNWLESDRAHTCEIWEIADRERLELRARVSAPSFRFLTAGRSVGDALEKKV